VRFLAWSFVVLGLSGSGALLQPWGQQEASPAWVLERGRVGRLEIGMKIDEVSEVFRRNRLRLVDLQIEGQFTPALEVSTSTNRRLFTIELREFPCVDFRVTRVHVHAEEFRTNSGVGVGSTLASLEQRHATERILAEGLSVVVPDLQMGFRFADGDASASSRVSEVVLSLSPAEVKKRHCPGIDR
jgi:hypothetical protein